MMLQERFARILLSACLVLVPYANADEPQSDAPRVSYLDASHSTLLLDVAGKQYLVDVAAGSVREAATLAGAQASATQAPKHHRHRPRGLFQQNCAGCHGTDGKGTRSAGTPDFTNRSIQSGFSDQQIIETIRNGKSGRMPAWAGKLSDAQITELATYIRSFTTAAPGSSSNAQQEAAAPGVYQPGDDVLVSLPTGKATDRHGVYVNFAHRFMDTAFTGPGKGGELLGLDSVSISSFGLRYGVTDKFAVSVWRSPSFIERRPIQLMAAYNLMDENHEAPLNLTVRVSVEGQNNFQKSFTENIEAIFSRSITSHAQFYAVPTFSANARRLEPGGLVSSQIPDFPGVDTFSIGFGAAVDILPTVALVAEIIPTLLNSGELGIHRPAYSFGIQKKIWRHAFTLALTNSPGTTIVSQRAGTRATYTGMPNADTPAGLSLGFDVMRQIH